jgi:hypothetical protein
MDVIAVIARIRLPEVEQELEGVIADLEEVAVAAFGVSLVQGHNCGLHSDERWGTPAAISPAQQNQCALADV